MFNSNTFKTNGYSTPTSSEQTKAWSTVSEHFSAVASLIEKNVPGEYGQIALSQLYQAQSVLNQTISQGWKPSTY